MEINMLPPRFEERMKSILKSEYGSFRAALDEEAVKGIRVNTLKATAEYLRGREDLSPEQLSYIDEGFIPSVSEGLGRLPEHHAGMFYVQDPGAMATVAAVDVPEGALVLDTCAAPGGKATQLAAAIGNGGFLVANEFVPKRAKIIVGNLERLGVRGAFVTSLDTAELSKMFSSVFDLVLCDAPCSGEGMFRKYDEALTEWSEENVLHCAKRQLEILNNSAPTVKSGGYLLYSTCTFSPEENEHVVVDFLDAHPEFSLVPVKDALIPVTSPGLTDISDKYDLSLTRRFYPHVSRGEGQFIAVMKKTDNGGDMPTFLYKSSETSPSKEELRVINAFFKDNLTSIPDGRLIKQGEGIAILPGNLPVPQRSLFMAGVMAGEVRKGVFFPHHQLFSAYGTLFKRQEHLAPKDGRVEQYLRGEEIEAVSCKDSGYLAVIYEGAPLGGGKASSGRIKNHYPKGLRNK